MTLGTCEQKTITLGQKVMPNGWIKKGVSFGGFNLHLSSNGQIYSYSFPNVSENIILGGQPIHIDDEQVLGISKTDKEIDGIALFDSEYSRNPGVHFVYLHDLKKSQCNISTDIILTPVKDLEMGDALIMSLDYPGFYIKATSNDKKRKKIFKFNHLLDLSHNVSWDYDTMSCSADDWDRWQRAWMGVTIL